MYLWFLLVVVHRPRIAFVMIDDPFGRDSLPKVGLEAVHAQPDQTPQLILIPFGSIWVGEIDQAHPGLPIVRLPYLSRDAFDKVALLIAFSEQSRFLSDV